MKIIQRSWQWINPVPFVDENAPFWFIERSELRRENHLIPSRRRHELRRFLHDSKTSILRLTIIALGPRIDPSHERIKRQVFERLIRSIPKLMGLFRNSPH